MMTNGGDPGIEALHIANQGKHCNIGSLPGLTPKPPVDKRAEMWVVDDDLPKSKKTYRSNYITDMRNLKFHGNILISYET